MNPVGRPGFRPHDPRAVTHSGWRGPTVKDLRDWIRRTEWTKAILVVTAWFVLLVVWLYALSYFLPAGQKATQNDITKVASVEFSAALAGFILLLLVAAYLAGLRRPFGLIAPRERSGTAGLIVFVRATALVLLACIVPSAAASWGAGILGWSSTSGGWWGTIPAGQRLITSVSAGITEETTNIAAPCGVVLVTFWFIVSTSHAMGWSARKPLIAGRWLAVAACLITALSRVPAHAYQGPVDAWEKLVWGLLMLALFWWYRSVLPLMVGHAIYDFVIAGDPYRLQLWPAAPDLFTVTILLAVLAATFAPHLKRRIAAGSKGRFSDDLDAFGRDEHDLLS